MIWVIYKPTWSLENQVAWNLRSSPSNCRQSFKNLICFKPWYFYSENRKLPPQDLPPSALDHGLQIIPGIEGNQWKLLKNCLRWVTASNFFYRGASVKVVSSCFIDTGLSAYQVKFQGSGAFLKSLVCAGLWLCWHFHLGLSLFPWAECLLPIEEDLCIACCTDKGLSAGMHLG